MRLSFTLAALTLAIAACDGDIQLGGTSGAGPPGDAGDAGGDALADSSVEADRPLGSCTAASGCGFDTLQCDLGRGECVECRVDGDCRSGDRLRCEEAAGRCVECRGDTDCGSDERCELARHECVVRCSPTRPCSRGTCDVATERCRECAPGAACAEGKVCALSEVCVECTSDAQCGGEKGRCDVLLARCVECLSNAHCAAPERCEPKSGACETPDR